MTETELKTRATALMNRLNALGFTRNGSPMVIDQAYELVAAEEGFRNQHVLRSKMTLPDCPSELQALFDWLAIVERHGWSDKEQLIMCQLFISGQAQMGDLVAFAEQAGPDAGGILSPAPQDPMVPTQEVIAVLQDIGYSVPQSDFGSPFWAFEDDASPDCVDAAAAWKDAWLDAQKRAVNRTGMFAKDWDALPLEARLTKVRQLASFEAAANRCSTCGQALDLEGWDGRCGDCADREENRCTEAQERQLADKAYESFDFGAKVADADGWETSTHSGLWTRTVFLEDPNPEYPSTRVRFTVEVSDGKVVGTYLR